MASSPTPAVEFARAATGPTCIIAPEQNENAKHIWPVVLLVGTLLSVIFQLLWFYPRCIHNIDFDGMDYVGIARHIQAGHFAASINAFRSPLISWLIALAAGHGSVPELLVRAGKLVTFLSFITAEVLLYIFSMRLWRSRLTAAVSVLWFSLARGILPWALLLVSPDYLFTALTLAYFILLESCIRKPHGRTWFYLGCVHGLAYLAKAFALPWLAVTTVAAAVLTRPWHRRQAMLRLACAGIVPAIIAVGWGSVLHAKYGVFTTGSQFRTNIMQWTLHRDLSPHNRGYEVLTDTSQSTDSYMVTELLPPHAPGWSSRLSAGELLRKIFSKEIANVPQALKEIAVVLTPGACLLLIAGLVTLRNWEEKLRNQRLILVIAAISSFVLVLAYCMMVFDGRYVLPIVPVFMAICAGLLLDKESPVSRNIRRMGGALLVAGLLFTFSYKASLFRTLTRDFQSSCVDAGNKLHRGAAIVTVGEGPFPEHGIGWEAGYKAAFFGSARVIASAPRLESDQIEKLKSDIGKSAGDAVLVWGNPAQATYKRLITELEQHYPGAHFQPIVDPQRGEVGSIGLVR